MADFNALNHMSIARIRESQQVIVAIIVNILNLKLGKY